MIVANDWYRCEQKLPKAKTQSWNAVKFLFIDQLEILCNTSIPLLRDDRGIFDSRVPSCLYVSNDWLTTTVASVAIRAVLWHALVVEQTVIVVLLTRSASRDGAFSRRIGYMCPRIC